MILILTLIIFPFWMGTFAVPPHTGLTFLKIIQSVCLVMCMTLKHVIEF